MAHLFRARETNQEYSFEVCSHVSCQHTAADKLVAHRLYTWSKEPSAMPAEDMVREVELLEAQRAATADAGVPLPAEGTSVGA